ncbi:MFS transporter [Sediminihabitans luteus]|uniref:MFS transporter n=1 Tax=Sediminihabitans luteus TaxID=1138585 RepID=A0A2M9D094_9CELL|nr:MFS transporter [Sediminihabitans luteus]PJJ77428.1 MFS transporter [Sediminihabitans luteus]GII98321.1 hypothetical protein Slu03_06990 [Sediminihabitans luteus]
MRLTFVAVALLTNLGNWMTFFALLVHVQLTEGSSSSALFFVCQTLPALLLAGQAARRVPAHAVRPVWVALQVALAGMTFAIAGFTHVVPLLFVYAGVSMLVRATASPLLLSMISAHVPEAVRGATLTAVSSSSAITLAVGPALGGLLMATYGPAAVLVINGVGYLVVAVALAVRRMPAVPTAPTPLPTVRERGAKRFVRVPGFRSLATIEGAREPVAVWLVPAARSWMLLLAAGATVNALETPVIFESLRLGEREFGWLMSAYGIGGGVVLVRALAGRTRRPGRATVGWSALGAACALVVWMAASADLAPPWRTTVCVVAFVALGFSTSTLSGAVRGTLDQLAATLGEDPKVVWTWASQVTLALNLVVYVSFFLYYLGWEVSPALLVMPVGAYLAIAVGASRPPPTARSVTRSGENP